MEAVAAMQAAIVLPPREPTYVRLSPLWTRTDILPEPAPNAHRDPVGELVVGMLTLRKPRR